MVRRVSNLVNRQFDVCLLQGSRRNSAMIIILQHDRFADLKTRIVAPLISITQVQAATTVNPLIEVSGQSYLIAFNQISTVLHSEIGPISSAQDRYSDFISAIDMIFTGY